MLQRELPLRCDAVDVVFAFKSYSGFIDLVEGFGAAIAVCFLAGGGWGRRN
jgi:hypothetical protein